MLGDGSLKKFGIRTVLTQFREGKMTLKDFLYSKKIKQVDLVRLLCADPARVSLGVNYLRPFKDKDLCTLSEFLKVPIEQLRTNNIINPKGGGNEN